MSERIDEKEIALLKSQELDRNRIARDLHDYVVQDLAALIHKSEYCLAKIDKDPIAVKLELQHMMEVLQKSVDEIRDVIYDLKPMSINNIGLISTIESYCKKAEKNSNIVFDFKTEVKTVDLDDTKETTIFRIISELINNTISHSMAKHCYVNIKKKENELSITVEDDGVGFNYNEVLNNCLENKHYGMQIIQERILLLNAKIIIDSQKDKGTKICINIPIV